MEVENDVELADVAVVLVHLFDVSMNGLEGDQLVVGRATSGDEEEGGITTVNNLGVCIRNKSVFRADTKTGRKWP